MPYHANKSWFAVERGWTAGPKEGAVDLHEVQVVGPAATEAKRVPVGSLPDDPAKNW